MWTSKVVVFVSVSLLLLCVASVRGQTMEEAMMAFAEQFRCRMIYEQENIGVPRLEPMESQEETFEYESEEYGKINMLLKNVKIEGLSGFNITDLSLDFFTLDMVMNMYLPKLSVTGWYSIQGDIPNLIELKGSGDFAFTIYGIQLSMDGRMGHEGFNNTWWMEWMSIGFKIEEMDGYMKGIMGDELLEDFFTYLLSNAAPELLDEVYPDIKPEIEEYAKQMMPDMLNGTPLVQVINIIFQDEPFLMELPEGECPNEL